MHTRHSPFLTLGPTLACLLLSVVASLAAPPAVAQDSPPSVSELRRENEQLRLRIDELEAQLVKSQEAITKLLEQVRELNGRVSDLQRELQAQTQADPAGNGSDPDALPPADSAQTYAPLPKDEPFAAPEALFGAVQEAYESNFGDIETPFGSADARARYLRDAEAWAKSVRRTLRSQTEWTIEVRRLISEERGPLTIEYRAVDPQTRLPYSDRLFTLELPSRFQRRVLEDSDVHFWQLRGVMGAELTINRERETIGFFDVRPFVGPYVEFGIEISVASILPAPDPVNTEPCDDDGSSDDEDSDTDAGK